MAIINYNRRIQALNELEYAKELAKSFKKELYIESVELDDSNFEAKAREIRYNFFQKIAQRDNYDTLITAHQLNDKLEWFLMQLSKGSGLDELLGMQELEFRDDFTIVRPLLIYSKDELLEYLKSKNIKYFIDESNFDIKYKRNYIRHNFANRFIKEFSNGLKSSFEYLELERSELFESKIVEQQDKYFMLENLTSDIKNIRQIDKICKRYFKIVLSKTQRIEILKTKDCVISHKIAVVFRDKYIYISPFIKIKLPKEFKESCRLKKIPSKMRGYLYSKEIV